MMHRVLIVGAGAIADAHISAYASFGDRCCVVGLVDLFPDKAREKLAKHGLNGRVYGDLAEALAADDFDMASICLPPFVHAEAAIQVLRAGKHVLVEKPMATCLEECDAMLAAEREGGGVLSVVAQNRFKTPMMRLKAVLESGLAGAIRHAQVDSFWWRGGRYYDLWWRGTWEKEGGGCTMNHAVHHIDIFQWLMGMPEEVRAVSMNLSHENSEVEDFSTAVLRYGEGCVGQITASLVHHGEEQRFTFQGDRARVSVPWGVAASRQLENGFPEVDAELERELRGVFEGVGELRNEGHVGQVENFLDAVDGRGELLVDGVAGRRTLELITAIYQASHLGGVVKLPLGEDAPFYRRDGILAGARHFHEKTRSVENFQSNEITLGGKYG